MSNKKLKKGEKIDLNGKIFTAPVTGLYAIEDNSFRLLEPKTESHTIELLKYQVKIAKQALRKIASRGAVTVEQLSILEQAAYTIDEMEKVEREGVIPNYKDGVRKLNE